MWKMYAAEFQWLYIEHKDHPYGLFLGKANIFSTVYARVTSRTRARPCERVYTWCTQCVRARNEGLEPTTGLWVWLTHSTIVDLL